MDVSMGGEGAWRGARQYHCAQAAIARRTCSTAFTAESGSGGGGVPGGIFSDEPLLLRRLVDNTRPDSGKQRLGLALLRRLEGKQAAVVRPDQQLALTKALFVIGQFL